MEQLNNKSQTKFSFYKYYITINIFFHSFSKNYKKWNKTVFLEYNIDKIHFFVLTIGININKFIKVYHIFN
jgi:hypothetical protein